MVRGIVGTQSSGLPPARPRQQGWTTAVRRGSTEATPTSATGSDPGPAPGSAGETLIGCYIDWLMGAQ